MKNNKETNKQKNNTTIEQKKKTHKDFMEEQVYRTKRIVQNCLILLLIW